MSLDLETHMHCYVAPSVANAAIEQARNMGTDTHGWLVHMYTVQREMQGAYEGLEAQARVLSEDSLVNAIAEHAIAHGQTTNSGRRVYLTDHFSVPFCSDDDMLAWHG